MKVADWALKRPFLILTLFFVTWKAFILIVALTSPGIGYDTSTDLLVAERNPAAVASSVPTSSADRFFHLVRWDAIYYSQMAQRGLRFEQEWAFGIGLSGTISFLRKHILTFSAGSPIQDYVYTGIALSHSCHWLSTLLLYSIANNCVHHFGTRLTYIPLVSAFLYIVSPAGIFLSAPQSESTFASFNMLGIYLYVKALSISSDSRILASILRVLSGITFGIATIIRSNGILSGIIFLLDAFAYAVQILNPSMQAFEKPKILVDLQFTIIAGLCVAAGLLIPQYQAYQEYCTVSNPRSWCNSMIPSIFTFVQSHYWNVGFLRYWTLSNFPLFLIAAPQLYILIRSGLAGCRSFLPGLIELPSKENLAIRVALPQLILAILALFSYHVQIISRLSSGYPFWYIWLAANLQHLTVRRYIRFFILYGAIQAGLYASFLPPA